MKIFPPHMIDFYKTGHRPQYPEGTDSVYANFTARSAKHAKHVVTTDFDNKVVFWGLQGVAKHYLIDTWNREFFHQPKDKVVQYYKRRMDTSLGAGAVAVDHIEALHDLGYLPLRIKAVKEGSRVNIGVPMFTIKETIPEYFWLTNYVETVLSSEIWKPCTTATIAYEYKKLLNRFALRTGSPLEFVPFQAHDFSARGMSGLYDAVQSGSGHLLSFVGTDTVGAIDYMENYYGANADAELIGCSVPATEHSVMSMGSKETEIETFRRLITKLYPTGIVSIVSDTWDFWKVITEYAVELKAEIMARQPNAIGLNKVVFRPDSGDPVEILCGIELGAVDYEGQDYAKWRLHVKDDLHEKLAENTPHGEYGGDISGHYKFNGKVYLCTYAPDWNRHDKQYYYIDEYGDQMTEKEVELTPAQKGAVECLWDTFGGTINEKGFKVLDQHVGLIYGDSITIRRAEAILERLAQKGFASCNTVFGVGSYTYQHVTRDTFGMAMKATWGSVNGEPRELFKDPVTDDGTKKSAKGLLYVGETDSGFYLCDQCNAAEEQKGVLEVVFENGKLVREQTLAEVRAILNVG